MVKGNLPTRQKGVFMTLNEMKKYCNATILQDETEIKKAIDDFTNLPADSLLSMLGPPSKEDYNILTHDLFLANDSPRGIRPSLDDTMLDDLTIAELSSILHDTQCEISKELRNGYHRYECYRLSWFQWLNRTIILNDPNPIVHRFLSIQLIAYINHLKSAFPTTEAANQFLTVFNNRIEGVGIEVNESTTLKDLLDQAWKQSNISWAIGTSIMQFRDQVLVAQRLNEWLFYHSLAQLRKQEYDIQRIEYKYRITLEERTEI